MLFPTHASSVWAAGDVNVKRQQITATIDLCILYRSFQDQVRFDIISSNSRGTGAVRTIFYSYGMGKEILSA
jgi:hypothetical protein